jgi:hypothetical protein
MGPDEMMALGIIIIIIITIIITISVIIDKFTKIFFF